MKLFALVFGSRWFWALLLIGGTVGAVELDRRGLAPWQKQYGEPVELPTVDLGEPGADGLGASFDAPPADFGAGLGDPVGFEDEFDFPTADVGKPRTFEPPKGSRDLAGTDAPPFEFDEQDLAADFGDEFAGGFGNDGFDTGNSLEDPFPADPPSTGTSRRTGRDSFDDAPALDDDLVNGFDPLRDEPYEPRPSTTETSRRTDDGPLDPEHSFELELEPVDDVPARPTGHERNREEPAVEEQRPTGPAKLVLDITAPLRATTKETKTFEVIVRNSGGRAARDVVLTARLDGGFEMPGRDSRAARKKMGRLEPGETRRLQLDLRGTQAGRPCVHFGVAGTDLSGVQKRICVEISNPSTAWNW